MDISISHAIDGDRRNPLAVPQQLQNFSRLYYALIESVWALMTPDVIRPCPITPQ